MVSSWFLSLMALSCCVCGLELNVAHTSYQAEEEQNATLDWTFKPRPDPSLKGLYVHCVVSTFNNKNSELLYIDKRNESPNSHSEEFSGRVQLDRDLLREGWIRLHLSSLRTQDSGEYWCWVELFGKRKSDRCRLKVTAARDQTHPTTGPEEPDSWNPGWIGFLCGLGLTAAVLLVVFYIFIIHPCLKNPQRGRNRIREMSEMVSG